MSGSIGTGACTLTSTPAGSVDFKFINNGNNGCGNFYVLQPETSCGPGEGYQLNTYYAPSANGCHKLNGAGPGYTYDGGSEEGSCVPSGGGSEGPPEKGRFARGLQLDRFGSGRLGYLGWVMVL